MTIEIRYGTGHLNWREVCQLIKDAPLGDKLRDPAKQERTSRNSFVVCSAYDGDKLVGYGRGVSDGEMQSLIADLVVLPEYQGRGVGALLMNGLMAKLPTDPGVVLMYVVPGKEGFYKKHGFHMLKTGMGYFSNPEQKRENGYI